MGRWTTIALALALLAPGAAWGEGGGGEPETTGPTVTLRNRLSVGALLDLPHHGRPGFELLLSDRLVLRIAGRDGIDTTVLFAGRVGLRPSVGIADRTRIRALGVRIESERWRIEAGRSAVIDGGWRLVDGVQALARPGGALEVGGWIGEMPDLWTTAPAPRFGGGPILRWRGRSVQLGLLGELGGGALGIDRAAARFTGRFEHRKLIDVSARAELEAGGPGKPVRFSELGLAVRLDPADVLRVRLGWSMHAGHAWLQGIQRDPSLARWYQRTTGAVQTEPLPWDEATDGPTHQFAGSAALTPKSPVPVRFALRGRYSHRAVSQESSARVTAEAGVSPLGGRLDLLATVGALRWGGSWRGEMGVRGWLEPDNKGILGIEAEVRLWLAGLGGKLTPSVATDLWLDVLTPIGVSFAAGYRFDNDLDLDRWNAAHTLLVRASWSLRTPGRRAREEQER